MLSPTTALSRAADAALEATVVLSFSRVGHLVRSRLAHWPALEARAGAGRRVIVTGANSGLGYATTRTLVRAGCEVVATVRSAEKGRDLLRRLRDDLGRDEVAASHDLLDLSSFASVRAFAQRHLEEDRPVDTIVHNAGALFAERRVTEDGLERTYQIHVAAPFLLTALLLPKLGAAPAARVVTVTSGGMYTQRLDTARVDSPDDYRGTVAYARAKRAQVALAAEWARRFGGLGIGFHTVHPGWALTPGVEASLPGFRRVMGPMLRDPDEGADTVAFVVLAPRPLANGRLWHDRRPRGEHRVPWTIPAHGEAARLWDRVSHDVGTVPGVPGVSGPNP